jgi:hypothetical protein
VRIKIVIETYFELNVGEIAAACRFGGADIVAAQAGIAGQVLAAESPVSAASEMCFPFCCFLQPSAIDSAKDEFAGGCWHAAALEFDALKFPFACAFVRSGKESLSVLTSSSVGQLIVVAVGKKLKMIGLLSTLATHLMRRKNMLLQQLLHPVIPQLSIFPKILLNVAVVVVLISRWEILR